MSRLEGDFFVKNGINLESSYLKEGDSYYRIRVRLNTQFKRLKYVEVVQNAHQQELEELTHGMD